MQNDVESSLLLDECQCHVVCSLSFTMSIHLFLGLPCLLVPCTYPWSTSFGYLVWSILCTWPKYCIRRCCMRFATSWSRPCSACTSRQRPKSEKWASLTPRSPATVRRTEKSTGPSLGLQHGVNSISQCIRTIIQIGLKCPDSVDTQNFIHIHARVFE